MGIEAIHYKDDSFDIQVHGIHKVPNLLCPVKGRPMLMDTGMVPTSKRLNKRKDAAGAWHIPMCLVKVDQYLTSTLYGF
jgi:hypothetical protein